MEDNENDTIKADIIHYFKASLSDNLLGIMLFGSRTDVVNREGFKDLDLFILLNEITHETHNNLVECMNKLYQSESPVSKYLVHPPIIVSDKGSFQINAFLAKLIIDHGVKWIETNELNHYLENLNKWANNDRIAIAAEVLAMDSIMFMGIYSLPHGTFLDNNKLSIYFLYHLFRWCQVTLWKMQGKLIQSKMDIIESMVKNGFLNVLTDESIKISIFSSISQDERQKILLSVQNAHDNIWGN